MLFWHASIFTLLAASVFSLTNMQVARAQYPVVAVPTGPPAVVSYVPERRGLFGRRVVYRPIVTPVASVVPPVSSYPVAASRPLYVAPPKTVSAAPVVVAMPVVEQYSAPARKVSAYYPPAPVLVPIRPYQIPVTTYYAPIGF